MVTTTVQPPISLTCHPAGKSKSGKLLMYVCNILFLGFLCLPGLSYAQSQSDEADLSRGKKTKFATKVKLPRAVKFKVEKEKDELKEEREP